MHAVRANSGQKIQRDKKPQLLKSLEQKPLLKSLELKQGTGAKAGYCACPLHTTSPKGWAKHLSHPSDQTPGHTLTLTPYKERAQPPLGREQAREPVVCSHPPLLQQGPQ